MQTSLAIESSRVQSQLLDDENIVVLTKANFFRTLRILLDYAQHPERRKWELFSYRPWNYILATYGLTFDVNHFAVSCGPQHACIRRTYISTADGKYKVRQEYAQPDFTIMSNTLGKEGQLLFLGEAKPMGAVEPDTVDARDIASDIFLETESQRQRQALLAFERHPESDVIKILMMCGSFWSVWTYNRSAFLLDLPSSASRGEELPTGDQTPPPTGLDDRTSPSDRSPPRKLRRTDITYREDETFLDPDVVTPRNVSRRGDSDPDVGTGGRGDSNDFSPVPSPPSDRRDRTWRPNAEEEPLGIDLEWDHQPPKSRKGGKKTNKAPKRSTNASSTSEGGDTPVQSIPVARHVLQLPNKDALNPWFRHFLRETKDTLLGGMADKGRVQSSWFDWPVDVLPDGDGHAPGYVLPSAKGRAGEEGDEQPEPETIDLIRVDAPPEASTPSLSGLSQAAANALMSPGIYYRSATSRQPSANYTPAIARTPVPFHHQGFVGLSEEDTVLPQAQSSGTEYDNIPSLAPEERHPTQSAQRRRNRESSPIDLYLARKKQPDPRQLHLDSYAFVQHPLPHASHDPISEEDNRVSADTTGDGASVEASSNYVPPVPSTPAVLPLPSTYAVPPLPSATAVGDSRTSTSGSRTRISGKEHDRTNRPLQDQASERRGVDRLAYLEEMALGPLRAKRLPDGSQLPQEYASMSRKDQETYLCLKTPKGPDGRKDYGAAFRATGMPDEQVRQMLKNVQHRDPEPALPSALPGDPSTSRSEAGRTQRESDSSVAAALPPPRLSLSQPCSAEVGSQSDGDGNGAQHSRHHPPSLTAGPSKTSTVDAASSTRSHAGSRHRVFTGAASSSRRVDSSAEDHGSSSVADAPPESGSLQAANPRNPQRRHDPVAATVRTLDRHIHVILLTSPFLSSLGNHVIRPRTWKHCILVSSRPAPMLQNVAQIERGRRGSVSGLSTRVWQSEFTILDIPLSHMNAIGLTVESTHRRDKFAPENVRRYF